MVLKMPKEMLLVESKFDLGNGIFAVLNRNRASS